MEYKKSVPPFKHEAKVGGKKRKGDETQHSEPPALDVGLSYNEGVRECFITWEGRGELVALERGANGLRV